MLNCLYEEEPARHLILTLAMMVTGLFLGHHVQLYQMALCYQMEKS